VGAGGDHGEAGRKEYGRPDAGERLAGPEQGDGAGVRGAGRRGEDAEGFADGHQQAAADQQAFAAEDVAEHAEGEFEQGDRHEEGVGDPGELGGCGVQVLLEEAVENGRDGKADLRGEDGEGGGDAGAGCQEGSAYGGSGAGGRNEDGAHHASGIRAVVAREIDALCHSPQKMYRFPG
jgi:hypothetical protein